MFTINDKSKWSETYLDKNVNKFEWKKYEAVSSYLNSHNYDEIKLDISDSTLKGTYKSVDKMSYVINDYQIRINMEEIEM